MEYILFAFLALLASAANTIFNRVSANKIGTLVSAVLKAFFIVLACFIISVCFGHLNQLYSLTKEQWIWVGVLGLVTCVDWIFYFLSIKRAHLEAFAPFEASCVLFLSNLLFSIFMFASVTKGGTPLNIVLFFLGLGCLLGAMLFAVLNKKINPTTKKIWVLYAFLTALAMAFTLVIVKTKLTEVPSDVIAYHQMFIVFVVCGIMMLVSKSYKELKTATWKDYLKFFIAALFNALLMVFRYKAFSYDNAIPSIINCIVSFDFVLVSAATVLFFKAQNKKQLIILIIIVSAGMALNVVSGLV